jgi:hypothetical protein
LVIGSDIIQLYNPITNSWQNTLANVRAMSVLGTVNGNGNVVLVTTEISQSDLWVPLGTGVGLEGSNSDAARFIRQETSYIP